MASSGHEFAYRMDVPSWNQSG
jgi:hypothetical protein